MKTYNYLYHYGHVDSIINFALFQDEPNVLVQVFCGQEGEVFASVIEAILERLPQAVCLGTTTDGEICEEHVSTFQTSISISVFKHTTLKTCYLQEEDAFENGRALASRLITPTTKLLIVFSDGTSTNAEDLLSGIASFDASVPICGGMAGDNGRFKQTFIASQGTILDKGVVGVSLNSEILHVVRDYKFDWKAIGVEHTIEEVEGNRIYKIDGITPVKFYEKYLGNHVSQTEFPLIVKRNGIKIARAVVAKHEDGSLSCGGNLIKGEKVRIGFGDAKALLRNPVQAMKKLRNFQAETFYLYSCMARRRYMPDLIRLEVEPFAKLAPTAGFFTYAEFFHKKGHNKLLNQTLTVVALSECEHSDASGCPKTLHKKENEEEASYAKTIASLTNLIQQSTRDYDIQSKKLEEQMHYSENLLASHKQFLRYTVHEMNTPLSIIMTSIELHEMQFSKSVYLENIEVAAKSIFSLYDDLSYLVKKDQVVYMKRRINLAQYLQSRVDFFEQVASKARSQFHVDMPEEPLMVFFNETKLQRIVDNNLTNAIKYTFENQAIFVRAGEAEGRAYFSITSHSRKIENPEKVFEEYYREEEVQDGFGLGLNLVRKICREEGVEITLHSDEKATTFCYSFTRDMP
ncbi:MAG: FIST C-terminal domain-containing protein [Campylobacterales bacterium]|nr:FIST C-terminal domain-containing protein [Campylobacterales bacterium]